MKTMINNKLSLKIAGIFATGLFALSMLLVVRPASADITTCHQLIASLRLATQGVTISDKDRATLLSKLDGADVKIDQAKFCDALQKLTQFRDAVNSLLNAPKPKISQDDANTLLAGVNDAIACVQDLIANAGTTCP
jgi:hypothetical protein